MKQSILSLLLSPALAAVLLFSSCSSGHSGPSGQNQTGKEEVSAGDTLHPDHSTVAGKKQLLTTEKAESRPDKNKACNRRPADSRRHTVSKYFTNTTGDTLRIGRAELAVPRQAMVHGKMLSITPLRKDEIPQLPMGMVNVTGDSDMHFSNTDSVAGYRFLPHGEHFVHQAASISVPYDSTLIPKGYTADDIHTYYYDELHGRWTMLRKKGIDTERSIAMAETSHFTDIINGIIKVPESPETQDYVPTGISELKAADPGAGIQQTETPAVNQNGTATLSYPFETPAGRGDIGVAAGLQYSSDGGSSFVGYGWNLPVQSIDIETRWGVPRFDETNESESYLLMGQQLNDRLYRRTELLARQADKPFFPTTEGDFNRIVRKGDSPKNYYWEVTAKDGTVYSYGGCDGQVSDESTLADDRGNRIKWALHRITDVHGNFAAFHYAKSGNNLYPREYTWTGFGGEEGLYSIEFETDPAGRTDAVSSGRLGVMQTDRALLRKVTVRNNGRTLRSYTLNYEAGPFGKTLLKSVDQNDSKDTRIATQHFDYYNDAEKGFFDEEMTVYTAGKDDYGNLVKTKIGHFDETLSILGGGSSRGNTVGGGVMVGAGWGLASVNAGASYSHQKTNNEGRVALIDINGDGMPDKVWKDKDGSLKYRMNLNKSLDHPVFGEPQTIGNVKSFSSGSTTSNTKSANVGIGFGPANSGYSVDKTTDQSKTKTYFQDFNADGLIDIAINGTVWFNHSDGENVRFEKTSGGSQNPIIGEGTEIHAAFMPDYEAIRDSLEQEFPLHDAVRLWRAPYTGVVSVTGSITKPSGQGDGVHVSMQHNNQVLWKNESLQSGTVGIPSQSLSVRSGDYLLFRVNAKYTGTGDAVHWDPEILYTSLAVDTYAGEDLRHYHSSADYLTGEFSVATLDTDSRVTYDGIYSKQKTSDDVLLTVVKTGKDGRQTVLDSLLLAADLAVDGDFRGYYESVSADSATIEFIMKAKSPINWKKVSWQPVLHKDTADYVLNPQRMMFNKNIVAAKDTLVTVSTDTVWGNTLTLVPDLRVARASDKDTDVATVHLTLKDDTGTLLYSHDFAMSGANSLSGQQVSLDGSAILERLRDHRLQVSYAMMNELGSASVAALQIYRDSVIYTTDADGVSRPAGRKPVLIATVPASVFSSYNRLDYGALYKGWGQFAWSGNGEGTPVRTEDMKNTDVNDYIQDGKINEAAVEANTLDISRQKFFSMAYQTSTGRYVSATDSVYVGAVTMRPSRLGVDEITVDTVDYNLSGDGLSAPVLLTESRSNGKSYNIGASLGVSLGVNRSKSEQNSYTLVSAMDLNGDSYPDWLNENDGKVQAQVTRPTGALGDGIRFDVENSHFKGEAENKGGSIGFSFNKDDYGLSGLEKLKAAAKVMKASPTTAAQQSSRTDRDAANASQSSKVSEGSCSASGNFSSGNSETVRDWIDLNGDGLPDMMSEGAVRYGLGYGFTDPVQTGSHKMESSRNSNYGGGLGVCVPVLGMFNTAAGQNNTASLSSAKVVYNDVNGDGLPDMIEQDDDGTLAVTLNTGSGFLPQQELQKESDVSSNLGSSVAVYASVAYTIRIPVLFGFCINITPSIEGAHSESVSRTTTALMDIDGDGLPDLVYSDGGDRMKVRRNLTGRTNMLRSVTLPFGGRINIGYGQTEPSFDSPGRRWVMTSVETTGGYEENGAVRSRNTFEYEGGYRDRREREFYGFRTVRTNQHDTRDGDRLYRYTIQTYAHNRDYHAHGLVTDESLYDADGRKLQGTVYGYEMKRQAADEVVFPALVTLIQSQFDEQTGDSLTTRIGHEYDEYGNLTSYRETAAGTELDAGIQYHRLAEKYIMNVPSRITVSSGGTAFRERSTRVDGKGNVTEITLHNGEKPSVYDMAYDPYGNITRLTRPENHRGERMFHEYTYDGLYHSLVTNIKDAYGYTSSTAYDPLWNAPAATTDLNGQRMEYTYDDMGRPATVRAPYEIAGGQPFTIRYEYFPAERKAHTIHYAKEGDIDTWTFADSLMRAVQTKQTGVVWNGSGNAKVSIVSGRTVIDALGRNVEAYYPTTEDFGRIGTYNTATGDLQARTEYDTHDRTVSVTLADGAITSSEYTIENHDGEPMLLTKITDALGRTAESYTDEKGRNRETVQHAGGEDIRVKYDYDPVGQVTAVHHPNGTETTYEYDLLGRKLSVDHPDAGKTEMAYDAAGNLLTKLTSELKASISDKGCITYTYDHERLKEVLYPKNLFNRVTYTYGAPGDKHNRAGRLALVEDASGGEAYYYGSLGEVVKTVRTVMASTADVRTYVYGAEYDSWNRVRTMTYPDGEVVTYHYNAAGQVESLTSSKLGKQSTIVERIGYDEQGHTVYSKLGNGTETTYAYDKERQRLQEMRLSTAGSQMMQNRYEYDKVDNILSLVNNVSPQNLTQQNKAKLGGMSSHEYQYDELNRLIRATGKAKSATYDMAMTFNSMSMPTSKIQNVDSTQTALSYNNRYSYDDNNHPTAPTQIGHDHYEYDANGNPTRVENDSLNTTRELYWDEDNRLMILSDNGRTSRYTYNHAGERVVKSHGDLEGVYINGAPQGITFHENDEFTLYPASIISINKNRFTKHYFIGDKRIASRIGSGRFNNVYGRNGSYVTAGQQDYAERMNQIEIQKEEYYRQLGIPPGVPTMKGAYGDPENTGVGYNTIITGLGDHSVPEGWVQTPKPNTTPDTEPGAPISWNDSQNPENPDAGYGYIADDTTDEETFFYHSDHLGSTSYITDDKGNITQYDAYLPYGELLVDEHSSSEEIPYKFNGKELDEETGLYYYGARYMQPVASIWYGVDPLMEKYPNVSGYCHTIANPLKFIDPDGRDTLNIKNTNGKWFFDKPILAEGNDVFNITQDGKTEQYSFNTKDKGDVTFLNLDIPNKKSESSLGIYHIHGSDEVGGTGFFVAPGGMASSQAGSEARVPDGDYPMTTPNYNIGRWRLPGLGGKVLNRGIRIHFGGSNPRKWTSGCFIISSGYEIKDGNIIYNPAESQSQVIRFNTILGASKVEYYSDPKRNYKPIRAFYKKPLQNTVFVGSRY